MSPKPRASTDPAEIAELLQIREASKVVDYWRRVVEGRKEHLSAAKHNLELAQQRLEDLAAGRQAPELPFDDAPAGADDDDGPPLRKDLDG